jgi:quinol monooxygenase YgiN
MFAHARITISNLDYRLRALGLPPAPRSSGDEPMVDQQRASIVKALFVRLIAQDGKGDEVEAFLRDGLAAVMEEEGTTTWYAMRFGDHDFAIFDTFPDNTARLANLAGKVGRALVLRTPELLAGIPKIEHGHVLAYKLPRDSGQVPE